MAGLVVGSVDIPVGDVVNILLGRGDERESWRYIVLESRLPQTLTATLAGGALAVSGLLLQTAFRNPLAAPDIFGVTSGASLMVAIVTLGTSLYSLPVLLQHFTVVAAAFVGAMAVTVLIWALSKMVKSNVVLIIIGIMVGYLASSAITLLNFFATEEGVKNYAVWGMGNFGNVSLDQMPFFATVCVLATASTLLLMKPLNALLLGERYAENLGIKVREVRNVLMLLTGLLTAIVTAYCGPIAFIALAVPHIARFLLHTSNHRQLLPMTILSGCAIALLCNVLTCLPGDDGVLPLNAVTPLIGAPVIIYVIMKR
jgi:iron complex transport system permease protein